VIEHTVLVVEDDAMVRGWLKLALETTEFKVVAEASRGDEVPALLERWRPSVILVDFRLPDVVGTELIRELRLGGMAIPAVVMTANSEPGFNEAARDAVAQGTFLKTGSTTELLATLRRVLGGRDTFDVRHPPRDPLRAALSPREREVMRLVAAGSTNRDIATQLGVAPETVKTLVSRAFTKLGTTKRAEAVSEAHRQGLL
jgi:DNA-binding NarL/FixJ family response regulator